MPQQIATLTNRDDQLIIRTPWGESLVVSAQDLGNTRHIYVTPPDGYAQRPEVGATAVFAKPVA